MSDHAATIRRFWETTEARDWAGLAGVLAPELVYDMAQTRERIRGREALLRFFDAYPGDWHLTVRRLVADGEGAATMLDFTVGEEQLTGITFFSFDDDGLISRVEDIWPEPYEPPPGREHLTERY
jgi:predicted ester cyclase